MAGLLDMFQNIDKQTAMGLLMAGQQMMNANPRQGALGSIGGGLQGFAQGLIAQQQQEKEEARQAKLDARQSRLDDSNLALQSAQAQHYLNGGASADGYHQPIQTSQGWAKWNPEKHDYELIQLDGGVALPVSADVGLAGNRQGAISANKPITVDNPDGSKSQMLGGQAFPQLNNNPGNLRPVGSNSGFQSFGTPEEGKQALSNQIGLYTTKHGITNLLDFTSRYAPKGDGHNDPVAYAKFLSQQTGIPLDANVDFSNPQINAAMTKAIPIMEQGWAKAGKPRNEQLETGVVGGVGIAIQNGIDPKQAFASAGEQVSGTQQALKAAERNFFKGQSTQDKLALETSAKAQQDQNKANIELGQKQAETTQKKTNSANAALGLLEQAKPLIDSSTNSGAGALVDDAMGFFGKSTKGADSAQALKALGANLVMQMPRMEGPQSDKDAQLYKEMAGQIADPWIPKSRKMAALQTIKDIQGRYLNQSNPVQQTMPTASNNGWSIKVVQ